MRLLIHPNFPPNDPFRLGFFSGTDYTPDELNKLGFLRFVTGVKDNSMPTYANLNELIRQINSGKQRAVQTPIPAEIATSQRHRIDESVDDVIATMITPVTPASLLHLQATDNPKVYEIHPSPKDTHPLAELVLYR